MIDSEPGKSKSNSGHNLNDVAVSSKVRPRAHRISRNGHCDLCYSMSNLALIISCIVGLYFSIVFMNDEPLFEYIEVLISTAFYRQIIFTSIVFPICIIVPIYNAISVFVFDAKSGLDPYTSYTISIVKLVTIAIFTILAFTALVFVLPYAIHKNVESQLEREFVYHMQVMYKSDLSYSLLERIQKNYKCCDIFWYSSLPRIPLSCYGGPVPIVAYNQACNITLADIISFSELMGREYDVAKSEDIYKRSKEVPTAITIPDDERYIDDDQQYPADRDQSDEDDTLEEYTREVSTRRSMNVRFNIK